jgi:hypothetical protein
MHARRIERDGTREVAFCLQVEMEKYMGISVCKKTPDESSALFRVGMCQDQIRYWLRHSWTPHCFASRRTSFQAKNRRAYRERRVAGAAQDDEDGLLKFSGDAN